MPVVTVSQLNNYMKRYIDQNSHLSDLWVKGEISNFKRHYSGHMYLTLKDDNSTLKSVIFKGVASQIPFEPNDGMKVIAYGKVSVYEPGGTYQLYIESLIPDGVGELYAAYEQLKLKLDAEGLFDQSNKQPIPKFPHTIGIISSISGAAIRDVLNVLKRRFPLSNVVIYPAKVQGIGSADSICEGLKYFDSNKLCDVIIIARGGGSIEDLWSFNEEKTARAIFECSIPVISGVGHETDFTIADFVADLRAPTPSAAAELAVMSANDLKSFLNSISTKINIAIDNKISVAQMKINLFNSEAIKNKLSKTIENNENMLLKTVHQINSCFEKKLDESYAALSKLNASLEALDPEAVLKRGYAMALFTDGRAFDISSAKQNDEIDLVFDGGVARCVIQEVKKNEKK